ncbi:MAG: glycosyltransferase family 4 protein [Melioribacteraceae bacterium]
MKNLIIKKILLIENSSLDFYNSRVPLYNYLKNNGRLIYVFVPNDEYAKEIQNKGINVITYEFNRDDKGLVQLFKLVKVYKTVIKKYDIDIIHSFRFQPNLLNVLANLFNKRKVVLHITGLGIAFSNSTFKYKLLKIVSLLIFQLKLFRANKVIVQNDNDAEDILLFGLWKKKIKVIYGSGVATTSFDKTLFQRDLLRDNMKIANSDIVFICVTRLIWEKGIKEMVDAFLALKNKYPNNKLWIVGGVDEDNPRSISSSYIDEFENDNTIFFMGRKKNIKELLASSDAYIYPSYYREGIPRGILEALSMSLPIITTKMPGCNLTVFQGENGYLISPKSTEAIKEAVINIIEDGNISEFGKNSRKLAESKFSDKIVFAQIENEYKE